MKFRISDPPSPPMADTEDAVSDFEFEKRKTDSMRSEKDDYICGQAIDFSINYQQS